MAFTSPSLGEPLTGDARGRLLPTTFKMHTICNHLVFPIAYCKLRQTVLPPVLPADDCLLLQEQGLLGAQDTCNLTSRCRKGRYIGCCTRKFKGGRKKLSYIYRRRDHVQRKRTKKTHQCSALSTFQYTICSQCELHRWGFWFLFCLLPLTPPLSVSHTHMYAHTNAHRALSPSLISLSSLCLCLFTLSEVFNHPTHKTGNAANSYTTFSSWGAAAVLASVGSLKAPLPRTCSVKLT